MPDSYLKDDTVYAGWREFFEYDGLWHQQFLKYCNEDTPIVIDYDVVARVNLDIVDAVDSNPRAALANLRYALIDLDNPAGRKLKENDIKLDIVNMYDHLRVDLPDLRSKHLDKLSSIECNVIETTSVQPFVFEAAWECLKCHAVIKTLQPFGQKSLVEPSECFEDEGGCGRVSSFKFKPLISQYRDYQQLRVINPYYQSHRRELVVQCFGQHCNQVLPGDSIIINGIYQACGKKQPQDTVFECLGYEQSKSRDLKFTADELRKAQELAGSETLWQSLMEGFAGSVCGHERLKEALLLQLFGGVWHDLQDGVSKRGSIHVLLVGDPGTVKSTMLSACKHVAPICASASGRGASVAGIAAGMDKTTLTNSGEGWVVRAGSLVRANRGIMILDEFDKLNDDVQGCLHTPMEQGLVEMSKMGGVNAKLSCRTSVLGSMNPKQGRFDSEKGFVGQIHIDSALLSRFDLVFAVIDIPDPVEDARIAHHIHLSMQSSEDSRLVDSDFLRKYIHHSHGINPLLGDEVNSVLEEWFASCRQTQDMHIGFRHYEAMRRVCEAYARSRLSDVVSVEDAHRAISLFTASLESLRVSDLDMLQFGLSEAERKVLSMVEASNAVSRSVLLSWGVVEKVVDGLVDRNILSLSDEDIVRIIPRKRW